MLDQTAGPKLTSLPEDVIHIFIHYLSVGDFIAFCKSSRIFFQNEDLKYSASYWSKVTRSTFRVPNYPVVAKDGRRWMALYRRMLHETKIYGWGNNDKGCLGGELQMQGPRLASSRGGLHGRFFGVRTSLLPRFLAWPTELKIGRGHIVSDLQCGGWSMSALTSKGAILTVGVIDGGDDFQGQGLDSPVAHKLDYPPGYGSLPEEYNPFTAIKQFSAGRRHILGLSDSGRIWSWHDTRRPGLHVKMLTIDLKEKGDKVDLSANGQVTKVVAGWERSSAYVIGKGIVTWQSSNTAELQGQSDESTVDGMLVLEPWTVPLTSYQEPANHQPGSTVSKQPFDDTDQAVGEVCSWCMLHHFVVFSTTTGHVYFSKMPEDDEDNLTTLCLSSHLDFSKPEESDRFVVDVQGAHLRFCVFQRNGSVLISDERYLVDIWNQGISKAGTDGFLRYPSLQNTGVIKIAFGDHHWHGLHSDGTISSYGKEMEERGSLGLGANDIGYVRGISTEDGLFDACLPNECYTTGRRISFEPEKELWLDWMVNSSDATGNPSIGHFPNTDFPARMEISEWLEAKLSQWESSLPQQTDQPPAIDTSKNADDDGLPSYFALSVAAGGWHSGAIVLVNNIKAEETQNKYRSQLYLSRNDTPKSGECEWVWQERNERLPLFHLNDGRDAGSSNNRRGEAVGHSSTRFAEESRTIVENVSL